jgi:hypothetical protein
MEREARPGVFEGFIQHSLQERKLRMPEVKQVITMAQNMVNHVTIKLTKRVPNLLEPDSLTARINQMAFFYFRTDETGPTEGDWGKINGVLDQIGVGLVSENLKVKTYRPGITNIFNSGRNAFRKDHGYVNTHGTWRTPKPNWTRGEHSRIPGEAVFRGDVHLSSRVFDDLTLNSDVASTFSVKGIYRAARTLIHEVSHKYAGTADFGERGYVSEQTWDFRVGGQDRGADERPLEKSEALRNADSYAWFVFMVCDSTGMPVKK